MRDKAPADGLALVTAALGPGTPGRADGVTPGERLGAPDPRLAAAGPLRSVDQAARLADAPTCAWSATWTRWSFYGRAHPDEKGREARIAVFSPGRTRDGTWDRRSHATSGSDYPPKDV